MADTDVSSITGFSLIAVLLLSGCVSHSPNQLEGARGNEHDLWQSYEALEKRVRENPCGFLRAQKPFFNLTGSFTQTLRANSTLYLFIAPNTSLEAALFMVEHCAPISRSALNTTPEFALPALPEGQYVLMVDGKSVVLGQGFPVMDQIDDPVWTLDTDFHGGDSRHSLATFSIHRRNGSSENHENLFGGIQ